MTTVHANRDVLLRAANYGKHATCEGVGPVAIAIDYGSRDDVQVSKPMVYGDAVQPVCLDDGDTPLVDPSHGYATRSGT